MGRLGLKEQKRGGRVRVTRQVWVRAEGAGMEVRAEDVGLEGGDVKSSESGVGEDDVEGLSGLAVKAGWLGCSVVSTL